MEIWLENILSKFKIYKPSSVVQIYKSSWDVDDAYILKFNENQCELDKSILLNRLLLSKGVSVVEHMDTAEGEPYVYADDKYWCLMKKIKGVCLNPFLGDIKNNGVILGKAVAKIHGALKSIEDKAEVYDVNFFNEISWMEEEFEKNGVVFNDGVRERVYAFRQVYEALPRQLIHRDLHTSNLLYEGGAFSYLDFDLSQKNVRIFDIVYLACSQLIDNYKEEARLKQWCGLFDGILQGYSETMPLSADEMKAMPALFVFSEALFAAFYLKIGEKENAEKYVGMTNWLHENIEAVIYAERENLY